MIAATKRRLRSLPPLAWAWAMKATRRVDRSVNRLMVRVWPPLERRARRVAATAKRWARWVGRRLRPVGVFLLRAFSFLERRLLRARDRAIRVATAASAALTPERAICSVIVAAGGFLVASQFVDYRGVEIGQPGYAGLPGASPPSKASKRPAPPTPTYWSRSGSWRSRWPWWRPCPGATGSAGSSSSSA